MKNSLHSSHSLGNACHNITGACKRCVAFTPARGRPAPRDPPPMDLFDCCLQTSVV